MALKAVSLSISSVSLSSPKPRHSILNFSSSLNFHSVPLPSASLSRKNLRFHVFSAVQESAVVELEKENSLENKRKLYVYNVPWTFSSSDIEKLFGECGDVKDVEIIKQKNGRSRGFAFITMASEEEANAAINKFDSYDLQGRIIRVALAKSFKKPSPETVSPPQIETRHRIYVSNLAWKVRSSNLRELFCTKSNPVSCRVVFDSPLGRSAGYGFVSFSTEEEVHAAISALDGTELMGRPIRLKVSQRNAEVSSSPSPITTET